MLFRSSGCLAVLAAHAFARAHVTAADISPEALSVARENVTLHGMSEDITIVQSDLFAALKGRTYDVIISNPPYVTDASMAVLPSEFRCEPKLALAAGADGNDVVRRLLAEAKSHLTAHGILLVDVGHNRDLVEDAFPTLPFTWLATTAAEAGVFVLRAADLNQEPN